MMVKQQFAANIRKGVVAVFGPCPLVCIMLLGKEALRSGMANILWDGHMYQRNIFLYTFYRKGTNAHN